MISDNDKDNNSIIRYIQIFLDYKKLILITTLSIGLILTFIMFFVAKPVFLSTCTLKSVSKNTLGLSGLISGGSIPDIGGLDELGGGGASAKEFALYEQILISRRCLEDLIIKYDLIDQYGQKYMQDALKDFRENLLYISKNSKSGTIVVGVYDYSPEKSMEMTNFIISQMNKINIEMNVQNAKNNRAFIEDRYNLIKLELKNAEDSLKHFQDIYGVAPDVIAKASTQISITLEAEIKSEEIKLELLRKILSADQSEVKTQELKISSLKKQLYEIKNSEEPENQLKLKDKPQTLLDYLRLTRNVEIQNKLLVFLLPIYEQAKIEEVKEMPSVVVLDPPVLPEHKVKPRRLTTILIGIVGTFLLLTFAAVLYELYLKNLFIQIKQISDN